MRDEKLELRAKTCIFLRYATGVKGYGLWCIDQKTPEIVISRDVTLSEFVLLYVILIRGQNSVQHIENVLIKLRKSPPN